MSALGRPRLPDSCWFLLLSGDMKSRGCLSGVRANVEGLGSLSISKVLSGAVLLPGVSGLVVCPLWFQYSLSCSGEGVYASENIVVIGVIACKFVNVSLSCVWVNAELWKFFT